MTLNATKLTMSIEFIDVNECDIRIINTLSRKLEYMHSM